MNKAIDNTVPPPVATPDPRISAFQDMEYDFHALVSMARIMEGLFEDLFSSKNYVSSDENCTKIRITTYDMDLAMYAYHDVITKTERLKKKYFEALCPVEVKP